MKQGRTVGENRTRVLFIAGAGRSGSTLLHNVLGQIEGFVAMGEVRDVWGRGVVKNWLCGCGVPFDVCATWSAVFDVAFGGKERLDGAGMAESTESFRIKDLPLTWVPWLRHRELDRLGPYLSAQGALFSAIREVTGARVVVDSSKNPAYGYLLGQIEDLDVFYLHLVREPAAVAYSWAKAKAYEPGKAMPRKSHVSSATQWAARNLATELFLPRGRERKLTLRYEDLLMDPQRAVREIVDWIGEPAVSLPFSGTHEANLDRPNHSVFGNAVRFERGRVLLRPDDRWHRGMPARDVRLVQALTWPLRRRYRYTEQSHVVQPAGEGPTL